MPSAQAVMRSSLDDLEASYRRVMSGYAFALGQASGVGRSRPGEEPDDVARRTRPSTTFHPLFVRLFVGTHVRRRLEALAARCAQVEAALSPEEEDTRGWLSQAREEAERAAAPLPSPRLPGALAIVPFAGGLVTLVGNVTSDVSAAVWIVAAGVVLIFGGIAFHDAYVAYRDKRELLLPEARTLDRRSRDEQLAAAGRNVYRDEALLFEHLGAWRRSEVEIDQLATLFAVSLAVETAVLLPLLVPGPGTAAAAVCVGLGLALLLAYAVIEKRAPDRVWL